MTREEALQAIKAKMDYYESDKRLRGALETLIPELADSEDERIRKLVVNRVGTATEMTESLRELLLSYLEKQKELPTNEEMLRTLRTEYEKGVADTIAKYEQKEQKPAEWSEEDKYILKNIHDFVKENTINPNRVNCAKECLNWLNSLPERFNLQPKTEWSEEDKKRIKQLIYDTEFIKAHYEKRKEELGEQFNNFCIEDCDEQIDWLKSLLPPKYCENCKLKRSIENWKPSEEQMEEYRYWYRNFIESGLASPSSKAITVLGELLEQLEKL